MHRPVRTQIIRSGNKELVVTSVNLHGKRALATLPHAVTTIFEELAPFAKNRRQLAFLRDNQTRRGPAASATAEEIFVTLPDWRSQRQTIIDTFAEELHHLVRLQNVGAPKTLGDHLALAAYARAYAHSKSGVRIPRPRLSQHVFDRAYREWDRRLESPDTWFNDGPLGKRIGQKLAQRMAGGLGDDFDLKASIRARPKQLKPFLRLP